MNLLVLLILFAQTVCGQDTAYYDKAWKPCSRTDAQFYRIISKADEDWQINDYYNSGQLQMTGHLNSPNASDRDGFFKWFSKDGHLIQAGTYKHGKKNGQISWYYDNGQLKSRENYQNGIVDGEYESYYDNGQLSIKGKCKNGQLDGFVQSWYPNGVKESEGSFKNSIRNGAWKFWNEDGTLKKEVQLQAEYPIKDCKISFELPSNDWYLDSSKSNSMYDWLVFKRSPIKNKEGLLIIPNLSIVYEKLDSEEDVIEYSLQKRKGIQLQIDSTFIYSNNQYLNLKNAIGYIGRTKYKDGRMHTVYLVYAIVNNRGIQIIMDMTSDLVKQYGHEFDIALQNIKEMN